MPDPTTDNVTPQPGMNPISPEAAQFSELAPRFLRPLWNKPKAEAIALLKAEAVRNGLSLTSEEARSYYDATFVPVSDAVDYDFEQDLEDFLHAQEERETAELAEPVEGYFVEGGCLKRKTISKEGEVTIQLLTNFHLRSIRRSIRDDGAECQTLVEIEAVLHGKRFREELSIEEFERMQWLMKVMGPGAMTKPRNGPEIIHGLKLLARKDADKSVYTHTGWRRVEGHPYYLHAGGAIGAEGSRSDIKATLPTRKMSAFTLPDPPTGEDEKAAIRASLQMLDVADDLLSVPLYAAIWRAPLGDAAMNLFLSGPTGIFKTAIAKLVQQHYGKDFEDEENILHYDSTANGLRESLFAAKDALCLIDEFVPTGSTSAQLKTHAIGEQVLRSVANRSGRARLGKDLKLQDPHEPRALLLSTGEDRPKGHSLAARTIHLTLSKDTVNKERLTACQHDARMGLYAQAMAGYLRHLAKQDGIGSKRKKRVEELRGFLSAPGRHAKSAQTLADLAVGFEFFLNYAESIGAITSEQANELWKRLWRILCKLALDQDKIQSTQDAAREVLIRLKSAVRLRKIFLRDIGPSADTEENQRNGLAHGVMEIGEKDTDDMGQDIEWLCDPDELYSAILKLYREQGEALPWAKPTLWERLQQAGYTKTNEGRTTYKTSGKNRKRVICIPAESFAKAESNDEGLDQTSKESSAIPPRSPAK